MSLNCFGGFPSMEELWAGVPMGSEAVCLGLTPFNRLLAALLIPGCSPTSQRRQTALERGGEEQPLLEEAEMFSSSSKGSPGSQGGGTSSSGNEEQTTAHQLRDHPPVR